MHAAYNVSEKIGMYQTANKKILIGNVGYHNLTNYSVGMFLLAKLKEMKWPDSVELDELNWGPIAIVQNFQAQKIPYSRVVILTALNRKSRQIGELTLRKWEGGMPADKDIQACIGDAVTGVISVENLLIIGEHFKIWPKEVFIIDIEPGPEKTGPNLDPELESRLESLIHIIKRISLYGIETDDNLIPMYGNALIEN